MASDFFANLDSIDAGHQPIENGQLRCVGLLQDAEGFQAVAGRLNIVPPSGAMSIPTTSAKWLRLRQPVFSYACLFRPVAKDST